MYSQHFPVPTITLYLILRNIMISFLAKLFMSSMTMTLLWRCCRRERHFTECSCNSRKWTERPFLGQLGSNASATLANFWPSIYETHVCHGVYNQVFRFPCATSNTIALCTETIVNELNDRFSVSTAPLQEQQWRILDRLYKSNVCSGEYGLVFRSPCATSNTIAICTKLSKMNWTTVSRSARLHCKSNGGALLTVYIKDTCLLWGVS
jgi:hypothetical protein